MVEVVAQSGDRLRQGNGRGHRVSNGAERDVVASGAEVGAEPTQCDGTPDAQTAVPDGQRVPRVLTLGEVELWVGDQVVDPRADDSEGHHPYGQVGHPAWPPAPRD